MMIKRHLKHIKRQQDQQNATKNIILGSSGDNSGSTSINRCGGLCYGG